MKLFDVETILRALNEADALPAFSALCVSAFQFS
jgi:hypothetical protein